MRRGWSRRVRRLVSRDGLRIAEALAYLALARGAMVILPFRLIAPRLGVRRAETPPAAGLHPASRGVEWAVADFGQLVAVRTPEDDHESGPLRLPSGTVVTPAGRLDNRQELYRELGVRGEDRAGTSDGRLVALAYERWGEQAPLRLLGDWAF